MEERTGLLREGPAGLKLVNEGIEIDAASVGKLVLECPRLFDQEQKVESKLTARWSLGWRRGMKVRLRNSMRGGMTAGGFDELLEVGLLLSTEGAKEDEVKFAEVFLDAYLTLVKESFRRHDPNHLLIGSRLQPGTIQHEWICRVMGRHVDVMSFNYYPYGLDKKF